MADKQVIKRAKYKSAVKDPGVAGVLRMVLNPNASYFLHRRDQWIFYA